MKYTTTILSTALVVAWTTVSVAAPAKPVRQGDRITQVQSIPKGETSSIVPLPSETPPAPVAAAAPTGAPTGAPEGSVIAPIAGEAGAPTPAPVEGAQAKANEEPTLDQQLEALSVPTNQALPGVSEEALYSVQSRYVSLRHRHEFALGAGRNFNSDSFVTSNNIDASYRFYLSDRWYLALDGSYVFNDWSSGADRLISSDGTTNSTLADVAFARYRADLMAGYHLFYGKFRLSMDQVFYFDQYVALGPGYVDMVLGNQFGAVAEAGFVFWFGRSTSLRFSVKDYFIKEMRTKSQSWAHNIIGGLQVGYVFGG